MTGNSEATIKVAIIGAGQVSDYHHVPGIRLDPRAELVAVCDNDAALAEQRRSDWDVSYATTRVESLLADAEFDAAIIATPNFVHAEQAIACVKAGKHVMCEKPLGLNPDEVQSMLDAAEAAGVVHMTAFTYRFAPAMRYIKHLLSNGELGDPRHFRSQRFLDLPETSWGWRQYRDRAGAGDLFDMTIHRLDFAEDLIGPLARVSGAIARYADRTTTPDGQSCPPSDIDDWSALIGEFENGAMGVWEGTTLAKGHYHGGFHHEWAEVNGSEASAVYQLHEPHRILFGKSGEDIAPLDVPVEFLKPRGSPRDPAQGEPATVFRYDLVWEFVSAIVEGRQALPSFEHGLRAQRIADAVLESHEKRRWIEL